MNNKVIFQKDRVTSYKCYNIEETKLCRIFAYIHIALLNWGFVCHWTQQILVVVIVGLIVSFVESVQTLKSALEEERVKGFPKAMASVSVTDGLSML